MRNWCNDSAYAIGVDANSIVKLRRAEIPPPDQIVMAPTATVYTRGDASRVGDGYRSCQWIWDVISIEKLNNLLNIAGLTDGSHSASIYVVTDIRDGTTHQPTFKTYQAQMYKPILSGKEGTPIARSPYAYQTVKVTFNKMVEVI